MFKNIADALNDLPDEMIEQAEQAYIGKRKRGSILWRVAALAATVAIVLTAILWPRNMEDGFVTAPGVLKVYGYDMKTGSTLEEMELRELKGEIVEALSMWFENMNIYWGVPIKFSLEDEALQDKEITFHIKVNCGICYGDNTLDKYKEDPNDPVGPYKLWMLGDDFCIDNGETIEWGVYSNDHDWPGTIERDGGVFADVIIRADGHIVGYAVLRMVMVNDTLYTVTRLACKYYPMVDGEFQNITEEYIQQKIAEAKQNIRQN